MKKIFAVLILATLVAGVSFAQSQDKVTSSANFLLDQQQDKSKENHLFIDQSVIVSFENRMKLNEYRAKFNSYNGRIYVLKNQIMNGINSYSPDVVTLAVQRQQLQELVDEHDKLIAEFRQWVSSLK